jgi:hypothetical protein
MQITRTSIITGLVHTKNIDVTLEQLNELKFNGRTWSHPTKMIQEAFPNLSDSDCEFIMTGITDEEWNDYVGEKE